MICDCCFLSCDPDTAFVSDELTICRACSMEILRRTADLQKSDKAAILPDVIESERIQDLSAALTLEEYKAFMTKESPKRVN